MFKKNFFKQNKHYKNMYQYDFLYDLKHKVCLSKTVCGVLHFQFCFVFIKFYISVKQNAWTL